MYVPAAGHQEPIAIIGPKEVGEAEATTKTLSACCMLLLLLCF
jgi:hypothetical protein